MAYYTSFFFVYKTKVNSEEEFQQRIEAAADVVRDQALRFTSSDPQNLLRRAQLCVKMDGVSKNKITQTAKLYLELIMKIDDVRGTKICLFALLW